MSDSREDGPTRDLQETRDELAQASIALNTAYDRLQDLRSSLRNFSAQRDRLSGVRTRQEARLQSPHTMGPQHAAIVLSDSDEESEIDLEFLSESLPSRLLELASRWGPTHRAVATGSANDTSLRTSTAFSSEEESRPILYPPPRRRRPPPPVGSSSRDGSVNSSPPTSSPVTRSLLEAHLRHLRHASNPSESTTTLGRRVAQRAGTASVIATTGVGAATPLDTIVHSTLPLGLESPPTPTFGSNPPRSIESRAAEHLRHSLLPNPPSGIRPTSTRTGSTGSAYTRFNDRGDHRPRTARSNSLTALSRSGTMASSSVQQNASFEASSQIPLSSRLGQLRATTPATADEDVVRFNFGDPIRASYRVRRRINSQGEEQVVNIDWSELMSEGDRDGDLSDPTARMRPPRQPSLPFDSRPSRTRPEPGTDDTVVHDITSREAGSIDRENTVQRRRGWARLDPDGDEISTEDEASFERARAELRLPRTRNWGRSGAAWAAGRGSTVAVLDFVHHNSRDAMTGHRDPNEHLDREDGRPFPGQGDKSPTRVLNGLFQPGDSAYINPLPGYSQDRRAQSPAPQYSNEVRVRIGSQIAGR